MIRQRTDTSIIFTCINNPIAVDQRSPLKYLFPIEAESTQLPDIAGLRYLSDYIAADEESSLISAIDAEPWNTAWQRRRQLYGASYGRSEGEPRPIPNWGLELAERMFAEGVTDRPFDQMLVNEYLPGQGISLHRDYETFDDTVVSVSLLSPCIMDFVCVSDGRKELMLLDPCSLLVLSGPARHEWQHGIAGRKRDVWQGAKIPRTRRLSVTFRTVKKVTSLPQSHPRTNRHPFPTGLPRRWPAPLLVKVFHFVLLAKKSRTRQTFE